MNFDLKHFKWTREPKTWSAKDGRIEILTQPHTDLWQRIYYHFRNDNAPVFQMETEEKFFSFTVKTSFESGIHRDGAGRMQVARPRRAAAGWGSLLMIFL